ncbi:PP2C family protein-serine/threonine phosphatase [Amycolatopsis sp. WQ 127309]|uniref:PP2C family protein-serine/threonine phosphatase n=1 Tax=Amycolatopsis sp. WQ 127309 TaxID=2932773 RepID=UPI001FF4FBF5|nr:PP2C family protein-serine/threonine phosphatase [Amycolatopsis sp. WQ 127309]UOZ04910.1 serine/threonine-protein phosphatase [Amycolatopsis sp. WQ 127309]
MVAEDRSWHTVFAEIVNRSHLATAGDLPAILDDVTALVGLSARLYLVDLGQRELHPVRPADGPALSVDATLAGRAFGRLEIVIAAAAGEPSHLWLPVLDGTERLGALRLTLPYGTDPRDKVLRGNCWTLAGQIAHLVLSKQLYSDLFHRVRRGKPLSVAAELLWQLLPPKVFATDRVVIAAAMEPYDEVGGDGFDYAVDGDRASVAIFDSVGHDLHAGLITSMALAATRNARRGGAGLIEAAELADHTIAGHRPADSMSYATAFLAHLDLGTGELHYLNAGHPPPAVLRDGRVVRLLDTVSRTPLGLGDFQRREPVVEREQLQPGDRVLFYTDGVTEARSPEGEQFGLGRLADLTERHEAAGLPAPETLRRVVRAVLDHQDGRLQDDATLLMLEWTTTDQDTLLPTL